MLSKRKIKAFLSFNWFFILLIYIGSFVGFYYLFDALKTPQYNEKINIFIGINHLDSKNMEKDLYNNVKDKSIKAVDVDYSNPNDSYYSIVFNTRGLVNTDILILPESSIENSNYSTYFIELKDNIITKYVNKSIAYTSYNNTNFGINATSFINKYNNDNTNEYYLFFNKKSNKIGELSTNDSLNDSALSLLSSII